MDNVDEKFANVVDYDAFSVRIAEQDVDKVRELQPHQFAIPLETLKRQPSGLNLGWQ